ncbi:outer membrane lipoprotein carrier protein LolA [Chryseobacterium carnipullorum]|uniref:Outer membrane lipoprotein carrier protein LolA n=1 Tax=Chryseobacterium carnipullorum TaxID=1124835 RepID=A0A1M7DCB1_CHRCU|nr:outer membrane lipoprotein carrier protein LolA [Chryseobacterium carnipullorum]AZA50355.1 outer membrane lipoprotein carrier protein LolA [Chryseobacterium carnipullorum]AZA65229.1 outer membrane lipoprotein carrier protein LolA [Chryseobacterium carnipullorum]SHL77095.1 Outer membrane lipoprotein-sorting protein [Chryseobacterium carnipullorum]STC98867.1 Outer membrane lipoprotein-sorting protein [Chryseobacterium carnipullorum]HBV14341.1 outer membrane lipoprotein carrier protein LolA [C
MRNIISKVIVGSLVVGTVGFVQAQKIDAKAKKILDDITANYNSKKNSYFKFSFGTGLNGQVNKTEPGIYYSAGDKYKLKIMDTEQIFDGNKIYNINADDMEVTVAKPNGSSSMFSPINYLTTYRNDYNVTYNGKKNVNGVNADFIKLTPVKSNGIQYVYIFVDSVKKQIVKLEQHGNNKDVAVIAIKEYKENQTLDPNMFVFDKNKFKNYIITEL